MKEYTDRVIYDITYRDTTQGGGGPAKKGLLQKNIDLNDIANGVYIIRLFGDGLNSSSTFIKE